MEPNDFQPTSSDPDEILQRLRPTYVSTRPRLVEPAPKPAPKTSAKPAPKAAD